MTKRNIAITNARIAGYHDDSEAYTRLICESRVNRQTMKDAWHNGRQARLNGIGCNCYQCKQAAQSV